MDWGWGGRASCLWARLLPITAHPLVESAPHRLQTLLGPRVSDRP